MSRLATSKKIINLLLLISLSVSFFSSAFALTATDIKDVPTHDPKIGLYLDLINGKALSIDQNGNFLPDQPINKASFLKAALTYAGYIPTKTFNHYTGYSDVPEDSWFAPYVKKALDSRILTNKLGDQFNPESTLTRQDALLLSMAIFGLPTPLSTPKTTDLFDDIRLNHPLASVYAAAKADKIYFENTQKNFYPSKILNRGDAADLLFKTKLAQSIMGFGNSGTGSITISVPNSYLDQNTTNPGSDFVSNDKFPILMDAWQKINSQYVYTDNFTKDKLLYGAINGMVDSLNDPYSTFKTPDNSGQSFIYIPENYEGIGAVIDQIDGNYIVETTITNSPAYRAGLKAKDIIMQIDGQIVKDLPYDQVFALIKGKAGTSVKLQVMRDNSLLNFQIVREKITVSSIQSKDLGNGINYMRFDQFTESSAQEFDDAIKQIEASGSKKLIIDLRNNPGGYLTSAQTILGHFLTKDQVEFYTTDKDKNSTAYNSLGNGELKSYKIVLLINEGSASAAEIFAGALQDDKLAYLIGSKSFGKGSVQEITNYEDNSSLKLTIAHWETPNKRDINHLGIVPDLTVPITDLQKEAGQDPQLDAATNYLR